MLLRTLQFGVRNLTLHKLRSMLTMLGTILGVGSVISMLAVGEGSKRHAVEQIRQLGANNVIIRSVKPQREDAIDETATASASEARVTRVLSYGLKYREFDQLVEAIPTVQRAVPVSMVRKNAQHGRHRITNARVLGSTPELKEVRRFNCRGRFLQQEDLDSTSSVCVLGALAAEKLFGFEDPLGQIVLLGQGAFRVVGVLQMHDSGTAKPGAIGFTDFNRDIYIPITTARGRFGDLQVTIRPGGRDYERNELAEITLSVESEDQVATTASMTRKLLTLHKADRQDFEIQVPLELLQRAEAEKRIWNIVLGSIAGISLLVGGIGIMNIMLATVTERTREIGIRRALGARRLDIVVQFLAETIVLSTTGGLIGIAVGLGIPMLVTSLADIQTAVTWSSIVIAFGISVGTGIVFGVYPARRAARLDPIEALRYQ